MLSDLLVELVEASLGKTKLPTETVEKYYKQLDELKKQLGTLAEPNDQDRLRWRREDEARLDRLLQDGGCDSCDAFMPGVVFPIMANGNDEHAWVQACECRVFEEDLLAAHFVGRVLDLPVRMGVHTQGFSARPYVDHLSIQEAQVVMEQMRKARGRILLRLPSVINKNKEDIQQEVEDEGTDASRVGQQP